MADGHEITLSEASQLTAAYRTSTSFGKYSDRIAVAFNKTAIARLMDQAEASGLRCYFAQDGSGLLTLVLVAYDEDKNDILRELAEDGMPCPNYCSETNDLNS